VKECCDERQPQCAGHLRLLGNGEHQEAQATVPA
jgi:hypothetical protein